MRREPWCAVIREIAKSWTWLRDWTELNWKTWEEMLLWRNKILKSVPLISTILPQVCPGQAITSLLSPNWLVVQLLFFFLFNVDLFKKNYWICYNCFCFVFWCFGVEACGMLAPWPGIKPVPTALVGELTTAPIGKSLDSYSYFCKCIME